MPAKRTMSATEKRRRRLLALLADGESHSGQVLAKRLRISRGGIWKLMRALRELGVDVQSVPRRGYQLPRAVDLLDGEQILAAMSAQASARIDKLDVLLTVDSTNRYVNDLNESQSDHAQVCLTEVQTAGRGRRGRSWLAPFASGICLSLGWRFPEAPPTFSALSLAVGVAVVRAFARCGAADVGLKWPNDLMWQDRKLGGILIEMRGESAGPANVVIGIGVNMHMPAAVRLELAERQAVLIADVHEILRDRTPRRNVLAAVMIEELIAMLQTFATSGFAAFAEEFRRLDILQHADVKILTGPDTTFGIARGVDDDGSLLVDVDGELKRFVSGEVSVRKSGRRTAGAR
jgi:BirA family biotin operon repressor/biotin-[acetyl-CoA-carboxylase] ligase